MNEKPPPYNPAMGPPPRKILKALFLAYLSAITKVIVNVDLFMLKLNTNG